MEDKTLLNEALDRLLALIERLPDPPREIIKKQLTNLKEMLMDSRPPRIMIVGRRGTGKSSLINAIFNEYVALVGHIVAQTPYSEWYTYTSKQLKGGELEILDTRGFGDKTISETSNSKNALNEIKNSIDQKLPDAIIFLIKATEVDAHISIDLQNLIMLKNYISNKHNYDIPILAVVTQVDQLEPVRVTEPPYENENKQKNIKLAVEVINKAFQTMDIKLTQIFAISAYAEYDGEKFVYKRYWNIDSLVNYVIDILPKEAQVQFARISRVKSAQRKLAHTIIASVATITAAIAATPIPIADIIPITTAQLGMIISIGYVSGKDLSKETAKDFLIALGLNLGGAIGMRTLARELIKVVFPGAGNAISAGIAFAGTWAIGEAAIAFYIDKKPIEEVKQIFKNVFKRKKMIIQITIKIFNFGIRKISSSF